MEDWEQRIHSVLGDDSDRSGETALQSFRFWTTTPPGMRITEPAEEEAELAKEHEAGCLGPMSEIIFVRLHFVRDEVLAR